MVAPAQYKTGKTLGSGTYAVVKEAVHTKTGKFYACKVISKKLMEGREYMVSASLPVLDCPSSLLKTAVHRFGTRLPCLRKSQLGIRTLLPFTIISRYDFIDSRSTHGWPILMLVSLFRRRTTSILSLISAQAANCLIGSAQKGLTTKGT